MRSDRVASPQSGFFIPWLVPAMLYSWLGCALLSHAVAPPSRPHPEVLRLIGILEEGTDEECAKAAARLAQLGERAAPAVRPLVAALHRRSEAVEIKVTVALSQIQSRAVPELVREIQRADKRTLEKCLSAVTCLYRPEASEDEV